MAAGGMEEDDLEYYIKFPTPVVQDGGGDDDFVFVFQTDREPVVFLLGWAGCQDVYLSKYSKIYEDRGCITIRYTPPVNYVFWQPERLEPLARRVVELLAEMNLESHPILFHVFSNGGAIFYAQMLRLLKGGFCPQLRVKGAVFDSGPAPRTFLSAYRALTVILAEGTGPVWYMPLMAMVVVVLLSMKHVWQMLLGLVWKSSTPISWYEEVENQPNSWPQLFLYSRSDKVICYENVEKMIELRRQRGAYVMSKCFDDSPHVQHLRYYTRIYTDTVHSFLQLCLAKDEEEEKGELN